MDAYSNIPRNPYGFLGSRSATNPVINSDGRTGPVSSYFTYVNGDVETTLQRVPPSDMPAGSYEVARDRPQIVDEFLKKIQTEVSQPAWPPTMYQSSVTPPTIYRMTPAPPRADAKISQAKYLKELGRPSIPNNHTNTVPHNMVPSRPAAVNNASAPVTIDSREAVRRYPNVIVLMEPYDKELSSTPMLDSKTAKDKYKGAFVSWSDPI